MQNASPCADAAVMGLDQLAHRVPARVVSVQLAADPQAQQVVTRLMELGFLPGESVRIIAAGFPGRDPLAVRIGQSTFALRRHEAAQVRVCVEAAA